jgi:hypothetical protein
VIYALVPLIAITANIIAYHICPETDVRLRWLLPVVIVVSIIGSYELGSRVHTTKAPTSAVSRDPAARHDSKPAATQPDEYLGQVKVVGPLANWMREAEENGAGEEVQQESPAPAYKGSELDHIIRRPVSAPDNFLHTTFPVRTYTAFELVVPSGLVSASLSGTYQSFTYSAHQRIASDIEVLLLDDIQFDDFVHRKPGSALYWMEPCSGQSLKWPLNSSYHNVKKYYFVFLNPDSKRNFPSVRADFTVSFN